MISALEPMAHRVTALLAGVVLAVAAAPLTHAQEPPKNFVLHAAPKPIPAVSFDDDQGRRRSLADFRGKVVLLNIWATWCPPCRREMPSLDRLQSTLGGPDFEVAALSIDRAGIDVVRKFYAEVGIRNLAVYIDTSGKAPRELGTVGVPSTLLIDREGRELGRLAGPAEWDASEIVAFLSCIISANDEARSRTNLNATATPPCGGRKLDFSAGGTKHQQSTMMESMHDITSTRYAR
jgi:thiol-disulfide isomerase/thioredoxin